MTKRFLTLKDIENKIVDGKLHLEKNAILSYSVKDYLTEKDIKIVYGDEQGNSVSQKEECYVEKQEIKQNDNLEKKEDISKIIEKLLRNDFGIQEAVKIEQITRIVKEVLK